MLRNLLKNKELLYLDIFIVASLIIIFLKFFVFAKIYPLHDELIIVERFTKLSSFLWRDNVSNHTLNSFLAVIIKSIFGYNLLYYRSISFLSFCFIIYFFRKSYPGVISYSILLILIFTSSILTNYIYIFRGYYIWAFLSVLNFFFLKKLFLNNFNNKYYNIVLFLNLLLVCHALFTLYIVVPIIFVISLKIVEEKDIKKVFNFFLFFFIPAIIFYFFIILLEGFVINFSYADHNFHFFIKNIYKIFSIGFLSGFKNIFFSTHLDQYESKGFFFLNLFKSFVTGNSIINPQYTILFIYLLSLPILLYRLCSKKRTAIDFIIITIIIFFYIIHKIPELRVHIGIVFFFIFYIFDNIYKILLGLNINKNIKHLLTFLMISFLIFKVQPDYRFSNDTKDSLNKIQSLMKNHSCDELNILLDEYQVWIVKNYYSKSCLSRYDFFQKKNILY